MTAVERGLVTGYSCALWFMMPLSMPEMSSSQCPWPRGADSLVRAGPFWKSSYQRLASAWSLHRKRLCDQRFLAWCRPTARAWPPDSQIATLASKAVVELASNSQHDVRMAFPVSRSIVHLIGRHDLHRRRGPDQACRCPTLNFVGKAPIALKSYLIRWAAVSRDGRRLIRTNRRVSSRPRCRNIEHGCSGRCGLNPLIPTLMVMGTVLWKDLELSGLYLVAVKGGRPKPSNFRMMLAINVSVSR